MIIINLDKSFSSTYNISESKFGDKTIIIVISERFINKSDLWFVANKNTFESTFIDFSLAVSVHISESAVLVRRNSASIS